jgi:hypothetical protein
MMSVRGLYYMNVALPAGRRGMFYCYYDPNGVIRVLLECCSFQVILHTIEPGFELLVITYTVVPRLDFQILLYAQVQLCRRCMLEVVVLLLNSLFPPSP